MTNPTGRGNTNPSFNDQEVLSSRNVISSMLGAAAGNANTEISPEVLRLLLSYVQTAGSVGQAGGKQDSCDYFWESTYYLSTGGDATADAYVFKGWRFSSRIECI